MLFKLINDKCHCAIIYDFKYILLQFDIISLLINYFIQNRIQILFFSDYNVCILFTNRFGNWCVIV